MKVNKDILDKTYGYFEGDAPEYFNNTEVEYHDAFNEKEFKIYGTNTVKYRNFYRFSDEEIEEIKKTSKDVPWLATHSAGISIRFKTDSRLIRLRVIENDIPNMKNMEFMGQCGFDLYYYDEIEKKYKFHNCPFPNYIDTKKYISDVGLFREKKVRDLILHFPLYCGVLNLEIGLEKGSYIEASYIENKNVIACYGTSILQGGCVSRPGICVTNIVSRYFNQEVMNFGFSGAGLLEKEVAEAIASRENLEMLVIDCDANAGCDRWLYNNFDNFLAEIYKKYPNIPIVLMTKTRMAIDDYVNRNQRILKFSNEFFKDAFIRYTELGKKIYLFDNYHLFDNQFLDKSEYTIDGVHPSDLGMVEIAKNYIKAIEEVKKDIKKKD